MKGIPPQVNETLTGSGLFKMLRTFPSLDFLTKVQKKSIMDALFCGKFQGWLIIFEFKLFISDMINNESNQFGITVSTKILEF
jgi:hypothetical protein